MHKKNKYGVIQTRIIVLDSMRRCLLLLDHKRKFRKEMPFTDILQLEIPEVCARSMCTQYECMTLGTYTLCVYILVYMYECICVYVFRSPPAVRRWKDTYPR